MATQATASDVMDDANTLVDEARAMMEDAHQVKVSVYKSKLQAVRGERRHSSRKQHKVNAKLEHKCRGFEAIIKFMKQKHQKEMHSLENREGKKLSDEKQQNQKEMHSLENRGGK